jgi:RND family efflux transporter MFP subunit
MRAPIALALLALGCGAHEESTPPPTSAPGEREVEVVPVQHQPLALALTLPGELQPFQSVDLRARSAGFVRTIDVDRGSVVHAGDLIARLTAPELHAQRESVEARLRGQHQTSDRLRAASATPGAIAGHDLELASAQEDATSAEAQSLAAREGFLVVRAPFDGTVTERFVHPGALVGSPSDSPLVHIDDLAHLRLVVHVPEYAVAVIEDGREVTFHARAYPDRTFTGRIARAARAIDESTRTMPIELDVDNADGALSPGMYVDVDWTVTRATPSFFVPPRAIVQGTADVFVVVVRDAVSHRVPIRRGLATVDRIEVFGDLHDGDEVLTRGRDDLVDGTQVRTVHPDAGVAPPAH